MEAGERCHVSLLCVRKPNSSSCSATRCRSPTVSSCVRADRVRWHSRIKPTNCPSSHDNSLVEVPRRPVGTHTPTIQWEPLVSDCKAASSGPRPSLHYVKVPLRRWPTYFIYVAAASFQRGRHCEAIFLMRDIEESLLALQMHRISGTEDDSRFAGTLSSRRRRWRSLDTSPSKPTFRGGLTQVRIYDPYLSI